jgi:MFS family permease
LRAGFYTIIAAQFFSSVADQALLIAAIGLLTELAEPAWMTPALRQVFVVSYVVLAPLVGPFADSMPKGRVMLVTNMVKIAGCALLLTGLHPLAAYAVVGLGAAAYSPAKYGILTELLPPEKLVLANGWMEGATVASIVLGFVLAGYLLTPFVSSMLLRFDMPFVDTGVATPSSAAVAFLIVVYVIAAIFNWFIPNTGVDHRTPSIRPLYLVREFSHCVALLWRDRLGQITLAATTLSWGAAATLQFIVLEWGTRVLGLPMQRSLFMMGVVVIGTALGVTIAARWVSLRGAVRVLPVGVLMGVLTISMVFVHHLPAALIVLILIGACGGAFIVPMNALLQHRGHVLMGAGHSIAVQNFNENLGILVMVGLYALMVHAGASITTAIVLYGLFVAAIVVLIMLRHRYNQRETDSLRLIG